MNSDKNRLNRMTEWGLRTIAKLSSSVATRVRKDNLH